MDFQSNHSGSNKTFRALLLPEKVFTAKVNNKNKIISLRKTNPRFTPIISETLDLVLSLSLEYKILPRNLFRIKFSTIIHSNVLIFLSGREVNSDFFSLTLTND